MLSTKREALPEQGVFSSANVSEFATDGFTIVRGLLPRNDIENMRGSLAETCDRIIRGLASAGQITDIGEGLPFETRLSRVLGAQADGIGRSWRRDAASPALYRLQRSRPLVDAIARLIGDEDVIGHPIWNARPKQPGQLLTTVPWHQDSAYFGERTARSQIITAWIPLVPVDERNGTLQLARGSHRFGLMHHVTEQQVGGFLELVGANPRPEIVVTPQLVPGDVILLHNLCWHRSLENRSDHIRWSVDLRYSGHLQEAGGDFPEPWVLRSASVPEMDEATWLAIAKSLPW